MAEHYYSRQPATASDRKSIEVELRGRRYTFESDAGVFSKREIDYGSKLLIESMSIPETASILDVGCGYGPIGLVAASLAVHGSATLLDVNERSVRLAADNAARNGIRNVRVLQSDRYEALGTERFDVVLTNPPIRAGKDVVFDIFEGAFARLNPGGSLWIVIQKKQGAPSAWKKLEELFGEVREVTKNKGYRIYEAVKGFH